jgi:hypothetical protein
LRKKSIPHDWPHHLKGDHYQMKLIRTAIFSGTFLLAVGAFAQQYPSGSQAPQPQGGMQPSQTSPNQPPTTQPSQNPGDAQQQPGAQSQGAPMASHPSIDDQVKSLSDQLNLTADQQAKVKSALEDQHTQAMTIVQDNSLAREDKIQKIHGLRETTISKVRTALNDDQKKKFDQMIQEMDQRQQQQQGASQPPKP